LGIFNFEFWIVDVIVHAKGAKGGKVYRGFIFLGEEIAHAKGAKVGKVMKVGGSRRGGWGG